MGLDPVALTALIISLVALVATTGQLLQQYFATADGYRRCQPSVMGPWGNLTRLRWRWREFRFETIYYVPRLYVTPLISPINANIVDSVRRQKEPMMRYNAIWLPVDEPLNTPKNAIGNSAISGYAGDDLANYWLDGQSRSGGESVCWVFLSRSLWLSQACLNRVYPSPSSSGREFLGALNSGEHWRLLMNECLAKEDKTPSVVVFERLMRSWDFMVQDVKVHQDSPELKLTSPLILYGR